MQLVKQLIILKTKKFSAMQLFSISKSRVQVSMNTWICFKLIEKMISTSYIGIPTLNGFTLFAYLYIWMTFPSQGQKRSMI
ncbi:hypothetical protein YA52_17865 [Enterobacter roggenkampii]|nr:hypothetical protein YA52_17865 [Enterobacter roggenkampii]